MLWSDYRDLNREIYYKGAPRQFFLSAKPEGSQLGILLLVLGLVLAGGIVGVLYLRAHPPKAVTVHFHTFDVPEDKPLKAAPEGGEVKQPVEPDAEVVLPENRENREKAAEALREVLRTNPDHAESHYSLATLAQSLGRPEEAEKECREVIRLTPENAEAHFRLGMILGGLGKAEEQGEALREAVRLKPDYAQAHFHLGRLYETQGKPERAEREYRRAVWYNQDYIEAHFRLGYLLELRRQQEDAEKEYREVLRINPDHVQTLVRLAEAMDKRKFRRRGRHFWERALSLTKELELVERIQKRLAEPEEKEED